IAARRFTSAENALRDDHVRQRTRNASSRSVDADRTHPRHRSASHPPNAGTHGANAEVSVGSMDSEFRPEILGFVADFPLAIAADAGFLIWGWRTALQDGVGCSSKVGTRDGYLITWPAVVELPAIHELLLLIEQEEVRRACSAERFRDRLGLV